MPRISVLQDLRQASHPIDLALLASIPVGLVLLEQLPSQFKTLGRLSVDDPTILSIFMTHFLHGSVSHLLRNSVWYGLIISVAYTLSILSDWREQFYYSFMSIIIAFPPIISLLYLVFISRGTVVGFSALTMAFVGLIPIFFYRYLRVQFNTHIRFGHAVGMFLFGGLVLGSGLAGSRQTVIQIAVGIGLPVYLLISVIPGSRGAQDSVKTLTSKRGYFELILVSVLAFVVILQLASPQATAVVAIHGLGYILGFLAPFLTFTLLSR